MAGEFRVQRFEVTGTLGSLPDQNLLADTDVLRTWPIDSNVRHVSSGENGLPNARDIGLRVELAAGSPPTLSFITDPAATATVTVTVELVESRVAVGEPDEFGYFQSNTLMGIGTSVTSVLSFIPQSEIVVPLSMGAWTNDTTETWSSEAAIVLQGVLFGVHRWITIRNSTDSIASFGLGMLRLKGANWNRQVSFNTGPWNGHPTPTIVSLSGPVSDWSNTILYSTSSHAGDVDDDLGHIVLPGDTLDTVKIVLEAGAATPRSIVVWAIENPSLTVERDHSIVELGGTLPNVGPFDLSKTATLSGNFDLDQSWVIGHAMTRNGVATYPAPFFRYKFDDASHIRFDREIGAGFNNQEWSYQAITGAPIAPFVVKGALSAEVEIISVLGASGLGTLSVMSAASDAVAVLDKSSVEMRAVLGADDPQIASVLDADVEIEPPESS